jgi:hypothetical protein
MKSVVKTFLVLTLYFSASIFLHELSHHLFGVPSAMSLQRNYPLVAITNENKGIGIIGSLSGPLANLFLAYAGYVIYKYGKNHLKRFGYYLGTVNSFLVISGAIINLAVDIISGSMGNDLEVASRLIGINIFVIPLLLSLLAVLPFIRFGKDSSYLCQKKRAFMWLLFCGWLSAGLSLMLLDNLFAIRFTVR